MPWAPGDRLLLYTDGLSEARNGAGAFLPLAPLAPELSTASIEDALDGLLAAVRRHVSNGLFTDDLAVLLLENLGSVEPPTARLGGEQTSDAHLDSIGAVADLGGARRGVGTQIDP